MSEDYIQLILAGIVSVIYMLINNKIWQYINRENSLNIQEEYQYLFYGVIIVGSGWIVFLAIPDKSAKYLLGYFLGAILSVIVGLIKLKNKAKRK